MTPNPGPETKPYDIWKIPRRVLIPTGILVALVALAYLVENIRGKHAWMKYRHELETKGEKLDFKDFIPPPVPDDQNFAMTPLLAGIYEPQNDLVAERRSARMKQAAEEAGIIPKGITLNTGPGIFLTGNQRMDLVATATDLRGKAYPPTNFNQIEAAQQILSDLKQYEQRINELISASERTQTRFKIDYSTPDPALILLPHLAALKKLVMLFQIRAEAELAVGDGRRAFIDSKLIIYLSRAANGPFLICQLVKLAASTIALEPVWVGLSEQKWSDAELRELIQVLAKSDFLQDYCDAIRAERAMNIAEIDFLRSRGSLDLDNGATTTAGNIVPGGWYYQNILFVSRTIQEMLLPCVDAPAHRVHLDLYPKDGEFYSQLTNGFVGYRLFARLTLPGMQKAVIKFAAAQSRVDQAIIACALERYRLKNGRYPEKLDELKPDFLGAIPPDIITGDPLIYRRKEDGSFLLYSVGWNQKDDGGKVALNGSKKNPHIDIEDGDWVWPEYPVK